MKRIRISVLTNIIPVYREGFYDGLFGRQDIFVKVYCQESIPGTDLKSIHGKYGERVRLVRAGSLGNETIAWQWLPVKTILSESDVIVIGGNPRVLSDAFLSTALAVLGRKPVIWTMARSYRGDPVTEAIRLLWTRIFPFILVYNDREVDYLRRRGFRSQRIVGVNNGLDQEAIDRAVSEWSEASLVQWRRSKGIDARTVILSCARLQAKNCFDLLVEALPDLVGRVPNLLWCVIGAGPEQAGLVKTVQASGLEDHVRFVGNVFEERELAPWFLSAKLFVHPAAVGLSLLHAFGYSLPAILSDNDRTNGPEYAAFDSGTTGLAFRENDSRELAEAILTLLGDEEERLRMGVRGQEAVRGRYNTRVMVERFVQIAKEAYFARVERGSNGSV